MQRFHAILTSVMARIIVGATLLLLVGCSPQLNPKYCAVHPEDGDCRDAGLVSFDAPAPQCMTNADCLAFDGRPACDTVSHQCVQCVPNVSPSTCPGTQVCGDDLMCHGCIVDTHCPDSFVCTPAGTCADAANVLYASPAGGGSCLVKESPCKLPIAASMLSSTRYILKLTTLAGTDYAEPPLTINAAAQQQGILIIGTGTTFTPTGDGNAITTQGGNVEVFGIRIVGATGANSEAVECSNGGLTLRRTTLTNNAGYGVRTTGCNVRFERNTISLNPLGAMLVDTGTIEIHNNLLVENGTGGLTAGNVQLKNVAGRFVFNTIAANQSKNGNNTSGIDCTKMGAGVVVSRNILVANGGANNPTSGDCGVSSGTNFIGDNLGDIRFANGYHLTSASPLGTVLDDSDSGADCQINGVFIDDIDGQARPNVFCDRGADEYRP